LAPVYEHHEGTEAATFSDAPSGVGHPRIVSGEEKKRGRFQRFLTSLDLHTRSGRRRTALLAAALAFVILAAFTYTKIQASSGLAGVTSGNNLRQSVAVLGFKNLSGEAQDGCVFRLAHDGTHSRGASAHHTRGERRSNEDRAFPDRCGHS
jgi:hypothetical protein